MLPQNDTWHPRLKDVVYYGMDWLCPSFSEVLHRQLSSLHGNLTAENAVQYVSSITQTGNLRMCYIANLSWRLDICLDVAYYDLTGMKMYVANARRSDVTTGAVCQL